MNTDFEFSYCQQIEPFARQLVGLLLHNIDSLDEQERQARLEESRIAIEDLRKEELENFLPFVQLKIDQQRINALDSNVAVIYPFVLDDSLEVILFARGKPLQHYRIEIDIDSQKNFFQEFFQYLNPTCELSELFPYLHTLYDWLILPAEDFFQDNKIKTLVFVLGRLLRNLPMAALHDGNQYLVEKYNIAYLPGLQLLPTATKKSTDFNVFIGALTQSRQGFPILLEVKQEIEQISQLTATNILLDDKLTNKSLSLQLGTSSLSVVHLATYVQLSSCAENTSVIIWSDRLNLEYLYKLKKQIKNQEKINLLVLTACKREEDDTEPLLSLSGIANCVQAQSTIGTLWLIRDRSATNLITEFYRLWIHKKIPKAEALRQAQISLLKKNQYQHPYYWSSFVLFGNWQ